MFAVPFVSVILNEPGFEPKTMSDPALLDAIVMVPPVVVPSAFKLIELTEPEVLKVDPLMVMLPLVARATVLLVLIPPAAPLRPVRVTLPGTAPVVASIVTLEPPVPAVFLALMKCPEF